MFFHSQGLIFRVSFNLQPFTIWIPAVSNHITEVSYILKAQSQNQEILVQLHVLFKSRFVNPCTDSKEGVQIQPPDGRNVIYAPLLWYSSLHIIYHRRIERVLLRKWMHGLCYTNKHRWISISKSELLLLRYSIQMPYFNF